MKNIYLIEKQEKKKMKRTNILMLIAFMLLILVVPLMAQDAGEQPEWVLKLVEAAMPLVLLGVAAVTKLKDKIPGIYMLIVMGVLSAVATWFMNMAGEPSVPWYFYIVYNLSGTFFHQLKKQWSSGN